MEQSLKTLDPAVREPAEKRVYVDLLNVLLRHKAFIACGLVVGLVAGGLYCLLRGRVYESSAQILVIKKHLQTAPLSNPDLAPPPEDYLASHQIVITSPQILGEAIKTHNLQQLPSFARDDKVLKSLAASLSVDRVFKVRGGAPPNNILNVSCSARNPEDARVVLEAVIGSYQGFLRETYRNVNAEALDLIGKAKEVMHREIADKESAYLKFRQSTPPLWKRKEGGTVQLERLYNIDSKRSTLRMRQVELQASLGAIEKALNNGQHLPEIMDIVAGVPSTHDLLSPGLLSAKEPWQGGRSMRSTLEEELINLQLQEGKLLESFGVNHPQVVAVRQRMDTVRGMIAPSAFAPDHQIKNLVDMKVQLLRQELKENQRAEQSLTTLFEREQEEATSTSINETMEEFYRKAIERSQLLYESIIKRLQEIDTVKDYGGYNTQVIAEPQPGLWAWKKDVLFVAVGMFAGLMLGFCGAWVMEVRDTTLRTPREICQRLGVPGVTHIPYFKPSAAGAAALDPMLCSHHEPDSRHAEAYRALRTALYFNQYAGGQKVLQVTSPERGDGKTTLAANLALSMAQSGRKVLLIDANFRDPKLHQLYGITNHLGLSTVMVGQAEVAQAIQPSQVPGLSVLPSGPTPPHTAELLTSPRLQDVLDTVRESYDLVLIDTPALWEATDPSMVAPRVDGVLLAVRIRKNGGPRVQGAKDMLDRLGAKVLSVVVNAVQRYPRAGSPSLAHYPDDAEYRA